MSYLHQVVDFDAAPNASFTNAGAIDAGIRLHLDVIFQHRRAGLRDLFPAIAIAGKAEAVAANDDAVLQDDVVAQAAVFTHDRVGVCEEVVANACSAIDDHVRQEYGVVANLDIVIDHDVGRDVCVLSPILAVVAITAVGWTPAPYCEGW